MFKRDSKSPGFRTWPVFMLFLVLFCTACGFRLRTSFELPEELQSLHVISTNSGLKNHVVKVLESASINISKDAPVILNLIGMNLTRRVAAVDEDTKPSEYELQQTLSYQLLNKYGKPISDKQVARVIRSYSFTPEQITAKQQEENVLIKEMENEAVIKLIRQLPLIPVNFSKIAEQDPELDLLKQTLKK